MIIHLTQGTPMVAFRVMGYGAEDQVSDWRQILLSISRPRNRCGEPGSPWYFYGCWPGVRTGVDVANPPHRDIHPVLIPSEGLDDEGRITFRVGPHIDRLPPGRYYGELHFVQHPVMPTCGHRPPAPRLQVVPVQSKPIVPPEFQIGIDCHDKEELPSPKRQRISGCILSRFDIDIGYPCYNHIIDEVSVELSSGCGYSEEGV